MPTEKLFIQRWYSNLCKIVYRTTLRGKQRCLFDRRVDSKSSQDYTFLSLKENWQERSLLPVSSVVIMIRELFVPWLKKIIWLTGVRRTVVGDWRFEDLCGSHLQSQVIDWLWRWLPHRSKRQSPTTVLLRTPVTQMIFLNRGMLLLGSNHFLRYCLSSVCCCCCCCCCFIWFCSCLY